MLTMMAAALTILATAHVDTTFGVRPGTRLEVENFGGSVTVVAWPKNAIKLEADRPTRNRIMIDNSEGVISFKSIGYMGPPGMVEYNLQIPKWMEIRISGVFTEASVSGTEAAVRIETVKGDVTVKGGRDLLELQTVEGAVSLEGARGKIEAHSVNEGVSITDAEGEINAESVNGQVTLRKVRSAQVECSSVNGNLDYDGEFRDGGHYSFSTHNGAINIALPAKPNAEFTVSTFNGDFESAFPVTFTRAQRGKRFRFTLGSGSADVELESFQGNIQLRRAGDNR
jgi:hypothetical protein